MGKRQNNKEKSDGSLSVLWGILIFVVAIAVWLGGAWVIGRYVTDKVYPLYQTETETQTEHIVEVRGMFGDSFGAINGLLSALAFGSMVLAIFLQKKDLKMQREDLRLQRKEFETQNRTLKQQRFENTFFNMLELFQQIVDSLHIDKKAICGGQCESEVFNGRDAISFLYDQSFSRSITKHGIEGYVRNKHRTVLDHYFRYFYAILNFAALEKVDTEG